MYEEQKITEHEHSPFLRPPIHFDPPARREQDAAAHKAAVAAASSEAAEREMAYLRGLSGPARVPRAEPPPLRGPALPEDFAEQAGAIDEAIYDRGVAIHRDQLLSLGRARFAELLEKDRSVRSLQRVLFNDLTSWPDVAASFASVSALSAHLPPRKMKEQMSGAGEGREKANKIEDWQDLWKAAQQEPEPVRNVYAFHDAFASLVFGQSLLLQSDGKVRSHLFCSGKGAKVGYFNEWLPSLSGPHFRIVIGQPLFSVLAWLCKEPTPLTPPVDLAADWFGKRAPSPSQIKVAEAILEGWLVGLSSWNLWNVVGRASRQRIDHDWMQGWCRELAARYPAISRFHDGISSYFWTQVGSLDGYTKFDENDYRHYLDREIEKLLSVVSLLAARSVEGSCVARFSDWLLCQGKPKDSLAEKVQEQLEAAFTGSTFRVTMEVVP